MCPYRVAYQAEVNNMLGDNQFGGRKGRNSQQAALINEIIIEYHRITYKPLSIMQHDVKACFDRTIPSITTICNRKFNIPPKVCQFVNNTKQYIKYYPVTYYGVSNAYYQHNKKNQFTDLGKGQAMLVQNGTL